MASKTTAYANSAIRVFWLNDGNRTHTQSATNFRPTIRLRSTYKRCVLESNQCKRFCRPSPSHSDNSPYCSFSRIRTYTLTFVVLCDNPFHYETICTQWRNWTLSFGFGDQLAAVAYHAIVIRAGFEPELIAPKTIVLPLHHRTIWADERNRTSVSYLEGRSNEPLYDICKTKKPLTFQSEVS